MDTKVFKKLIKEAVKEAIQEEMKDILLEAVRNPRTVMQENQEKICLMLLVATIKLKL